MNRDDIVKAIDVAAQARIARLFDVLCQEITGPSEDYRTEAVSRFLNGIRLVNGARTVAVDAIDREAQA